jgi:hypothetical protein
LSNRRACLKFVENQRLAALMRTLSVGFWLFAVDRLLRCRQLARCWRLYSESLYSECWIGVKIIIKDIYIPFSY